MRRRGRRRGPAVGLGRGSLLCRDLVGLSLSDKEEDRGERIVVLCCAVLWGLAYFYLGIHVRRGGGEARGAAGMGSDIDLWLIG